jgi:hypothetical protein
VERSFFKGIILRTALKPSFVVFAYICSMRILFLIIFLGAAYAYYGQDSQLQTQLKVKQLIEKKAEYHRLTAGEQDGFRIKIHFGVEKDQTHAVRNKFTNRFNDISTYEEYQQPNWVVLVGDYKTKLEAFEQLQKFKADFPGAFIVKDKIRVK